ncbi:MAG: hypothetical protein NT105_16465 [Verrucomicrobia bacterium]|nr:hypothetical protein [Verrucomicrobiota bacterium]
MKTDQTVPLLAFIAFCACSSAAETTLVLKSHPVENAAAKQEPEVLDFRYQPERWQTCIGLPDDPFKTIIGCDGGLYYDYGRSGPANYTLGGGRFGTRLLAALDVEGEATAKCQQLQSARVPVVTTRHKQGTLELRQVAWANAPKGRSVDEWSAKRRDFLRLTVANTGQVPAAAKLRLEAGAVVSLKLDESRTRLVTDAGQTFCWFSRPCMPAQAEQIQSAVCSKHPVSVTRNWAKPNTPCATSFRHVLVGHRSPLAFEFAAEKGRKYVVALGFIEGWHPEPGKRPLEIQIEGKTVRSLDLVKEFGRNTPVVLEFPAQDTDGDGKLSIAVKSPPGAQDASTILSCLWIFPAGNALDRTKILAGEVGSAALAVVDADHPPAAPRSLTLTWDLGQLDPGRETELLVVVPQGAAAKSAAGPLDAKAELKRAVAFWEKVNLPYGRVEVADPAAQGLLDSCVRNIYQAREIKDGLPAFQVGPTTYRGLWVVDGSFILEAATLLGRADEARRGIDYLMSFQKPDGGFMLINGHWKETGIVLWAVTHHARLTGDKAWLAAMWPKLERGFEYIRSLRKQASVDPNSPGAGLMPEGFSDGGLSGPAHEYTNIYWTMIGLRAAVQAAEWLGKNEQAASWQKEYNDYMATFRRAAARDMRFDGHGNRCLPIVMKAPAELLPQKAQWGFLHALHPGGVFEPGDELVRGNMAMLAANEREGLVFDTGWLSEGLWNYFGSFYGHAWLWLGHGRKAAATLYAFGNHASPLLCWREEQRPVGEKPGYVSDMPHNWASAEFIRLACHLMVLERGDELHLLEGMPRAWVKPGAKNRLKNIPTIFGPVSLALRVSDDGRTATLDITPPRREPASKLVVHLEHFGREIESASVNGKRIVGDTLTLPSKEAALVVLSFK